MAISVSTKKRQSRLNFTPAPSSSPARSEAFVRVDDASSPTKKRRLCSDGSANSYGIDQNMSPDTLKLKSVRIPSVSAAYNLPTPAPSSQAQPRQEEPSESDDSDIHGITRRKSRPNDAGKMQKSMAVNGISKSPSKQGDDAVYLSSETDPETRREQSDSPSSRNKTTKRIPMAKSFIKGRVLSRKKGISTKVRTQKSRKPRWKYEQISSESEGGESNAILSSIERNGGSTSIPHRASRNLRSRPREHESSSSPPRSLRSSNSPSRTMKPELDWQLSGTESEEEQVVNSSRKTTSGRRNVAPGSVAGTRDNENHTTVISSNEEVDPSESEPDAVITPSKGRRRHLVQSRTPTGKSHEGESDLEEEVADLADSEIELQETRTRGKPQAKARNSRLDKLEELKRRRKAPLISSDDATEDSSDEAVEAPFEAYDAEAEGRPSLRGGTAENPDEYESDFVDDDDNGNDGENHIDVDLARGGVPIELTRYGRLKPFEYFKHEVEWMIHNKLNPAFNRHDEIYELSHRKLDDEFQGQAGSKFLSSVWRPEFMAALKGRPECNILPIPAMLEDKCAACNRSGHPPTAKITFSGKKYDRHSLEPLSKDQDDDSDIGTESSDDEDGAEEEEFFIGSRCCQNAEIGHTLYHWRYQLNDFILNWLADEQHLTPTKIVEREKWSNKKREKLANRIHDDMVAGKQMNMLYQQFKGSLEAARDSKPDRYVPRHRR